LVVPLAIRRDPTATPTMIAFTAHRPGACTVIQTYIHFPLAPAMIVCLLNARQRRKNAIDTSTMPMTIIATTYIGNAIPAPTDFSPGNSRIAEP
jgi:hypothetical protein